MLSNAALAVKSLQRTAVPSSRVKCLLSDSGLPDPFLVTSPEVDLETTGKGAIKKKCRKRAEHSPSPGRMPKRTDRNLPGRTPKASSVQFGFGENKSDSAKF